MRTKTPPEYHLYVGRPVGWGLEIAAMGSYLLRLGASLRQFPEIRHLSTSHYTNSRVAMSRNWLVKNAQEVGATHLLMVDPDMVPDIGGVRFFDEAWPFILEHPGSICAAPYCGPSPKKDVHVFGVSREYPSRMVRLPREQYGDYAGWVRAVGVGTGLMLIDMTVFDKLKHPYFDDAYHDETKCELKNSQDVVFCRKASEAQIPIYVNFLTPAGHQQTIVETLPDAGSGPLNQITKLYIEEDDAGHSYPAGL